MNRKQYRVLYLTPDGHKQYNKFWRKDLADTWAKMLTERGYLVLGILDNIVEVWRYDL